MTTMGMSETADVRMVRELARTKWMELRGTRSSLVAHPALMAYKLGSPEQSAITVDLAITGLNGGDRLVAVADGAAPARTTKTFSKVSVTMARRAKTHPMTDGALMFDPNRLLGDEEWLRDAFLSYNSSLMDMVHSLAATSSGYDTGSGSADIDLSSHLAAKIAMRSRNVMGEYLAVYSSVSYGKLEQAFLTAGIAGGAWLPEGASALQRPGDALGLQGKLFGVDVVVDNGVTVDGSGDWRNYMIAPGGIAWADAAFRAPPAGFEGLITDFDGGKVRIARSYDQELGEWIITVSSWFGGSVGDSGRIQRILDDAT